MNKLLKPILIIVLVGVIFGCLYTVAMRSLKKSAPVQAEPPPPEWTHATSLLLDIEFEYKTDTFTILEGDTYDYQLNMIAKDWGIYVHRLEGFAKAFITGKPTAELYQLIGDSDLYKWQQAWELTPSEPIYSIYTKDEREHLRQDFTVDVTKETDIPDYFSPLLSEGIRSGEILKIAGGTFYYISSSDIYMVHYIASYPLGDKNNILVETINRIKFNSGSEADSTSQVNETDKPEPETKSTDPSENDSTSEPSKTSENGRSDDGGSGGGDIKPLPPLDSSG